MLAVAAPTQLKFPLYASPKLDGVRAVVKDSLIVSRTLKPIPNNFIQDMLGNGQFEGMDGELTVGPSNAPNVMQVTMSGVMTEEGEPDFTFWVFDYWTDPLLQFHRRHKALSDAFASNTYLQGFTRIRLLPQTLVENARDLDSYVATTLRAGYEGVIVRSPSGPYKYGRSTAREGYMLKIKKFTDGEAVVIGFEERMHNGNEATTNALGRTERSTHKANLVPMDTLGALVVKDLQTGAGFSIGTGFDDATRKHIWDNRQSYIDQIACYKHFEIGVKVAPRFPVFKGFRHAIDVGNPPPAAV